MNRVLLYLACYEVAKDMYEEAKKANSKEQQAIIQPMFEKAFPNCGKYEDSWQLDDNQEEINKWENENGIMEICNKIALKNSPMIDSLCESLKEAELMLVNASMDLLTESGNLPIEDIGKLRTKVNLKGYSREREKIIEFLVNSAKKKREEFAKEK